MTPVSQQRLETIIKELVGTSKSLYDVCNDEELDDPQVAAHVDAHIFECSCCSWWCELSDASERHRGELRCDECAED
jgi:hypothetical protein